MKLNHLSDEALRVSTQKATQDERAATSVVLHHLREVDRRRLFSKWKYQDLKSYAVGELNYSEDEAWLRISAMQLLKELPELEEKINQGALKLSTLVLAKRAFANEVKLSTELKPQFELGSQIKFEPQTESTLQIGLNDQSSAPPGSLRLTPAVRPLRSKEDKLRVLEKLENVSKREAIKIIERETGVSVKSQESIRPLSDGSFEMKSIVTKEVLENIERAKGLLGHSHPNISQGKLLELALKALVRELDPTAKAKKAIQRLERKSKKSLGASAMGQPFESANDSEGESAGRNVNSSSTVLEQSRKSLHQKPQKAALSYSTRNGNIEKLRYNPSYIPSTVRHHVWMRDEGQCTNCKSSYAVQYEHIKPLAKGGMSTTENLKLLCRNCNQRSAIEQYGIKKMSLYLKAPLVQYH